MQCRAKVLDTVRKTILHHHLLQQGDALLVGLSGGADSVCLCHVLKILSAEWNLRLVAVHVHHGIRGAEADRDAAFSEALAEKWGIPFYLRRVDVPALAEKEGLSEETAGRVARYRCFREICCREKISLIATAHNQNDQAETVLMRILRGSGIQGLAGIRYCREDGVIRPLLDVSRQEIEAYCREENLDYCTDHTNEEETYLRNRIRHRLIPLLEEEFNPNLVGTLSTLAQNMAEDGDFLEGYGERLYRRLGSPLPKRKPTMLEIESLKLLENALCMRLLQRAAREVMGKGYKAERIHWEQVHDLLEKETGAQTTLPCGLLVSVRYGWLVFEKEEAEEVTPDYAYSVREGESYRLPGGIVTIAESNADYSAPEGSLLLDGDKAEAAEPVLRTRQEGDRIALYREGRSKKLKSFMIDCKIPRRERDRIPLLCSGNEVLAVLGYRVAEPYKMDHNTKKGWVITYDAEDEGRHDHADRERD